MSDYSWGLVIGVFFGGGIVLMVAVIGTLIHDWLTGGEE